MYCIVLYFIGILKRQAYLRSFKIAGHVGTRIFYVHKFLISVPFRVPEIFKHQNYFIIIKEVVFSFKMYHVSGKFTKICGHSEFYFTVYCS